MKNKVKYLYQLADKVGMSNTTARKYLKSGGDSIVQQLLRAKRDLEFDKLLKKLSRFDVMMIDDFGYVKQDRDEMEVLFTLLAYRYERGRMLITSNLPFSKWEMIFKDPMTTAAAIDRLVNICIECIG
jgi:DNA replication protein DnaC